MQGKHFNEFQYAADKKTSLIKMDLCIFFFYIKCRFCLSSCDFPKDADPHMRLMTKETQRKKRRSVFSL